MDSTGTRDVIVIGASLGGIEALKALVAGLPADLPAAILIAQHTSHGSAGLLADILGSSGRLPAVMATDRLPLERGRIVVAVPDRHLLLARDGIRVVFGPRENRSRPAIDPLFRTAAVHYRSRVIGVILSGLLGDGAAGLVAVRRCGGCALVQAPEDAAYPDMPRRALAAVDRAQQVPLAELPGLLQSLVLEPAPDPPPVPEALRIEVELTERAMRNEDWSGVPSHSTDFTCPDCGGALRAVEDNGGRRYRCRVGHVFSPDALVQAKDESVEEALWLALQTLQERAQMLDALADEDGHRGWSRSAETNRSRAGETREHAARLRDFIQRLGV